MGGRADSEVSSQVHAGRPFRGCGFGPPRPVVCLSLANRSVFHWRIGCCNEDSTSLGLRLLGLGNQKVKTLCGRASKFDLDQSERKSSQNNARARNAGPNKSQGDLSFQIASTYPENSTLRWNRSSKFLLPRLVSRRCLSFVTDLF